MRKEESQKSQQKQLCLLRFESKGIDQSEQESSESCFDSDSHSKKMKEIL